MLAELLMTASDKPKLAPAALVFYDSCLSFCAMCIYWSDPLPVPLPASLPSSEIPARPPALSTTTLPRHHVRKDRMRMLRRLSVKSEREGSIRYLGEQPLRGWGIVLAGSSAAFGCRRVSTLDASTHTLHQPSHQVPIVACRYNMTLFYFTLVASALSALVATNCLKTTLIGATAVIDGVRSIFNWAAIFVFFIGVSSWNRNPSFI